MELDTKGLPVPDVLEIDIKPATKWQHDLDRQLHSPAKAKVWCNSIHKPLPNRGNPDEPIPFTFS